MRFFLLFLAIIVLSACQSEETGEQSISKSDAENNLSSSTSGASQKVPPNGLIELTAEALLSEDAACVIPLRISNGTDRSVSVSMFGFAVTGSGTDDTGNMFPQDVPAGEYRTARIIQIGQSCAAFNTLTPKDVLCKTEGEDCDVTFEDSPELKFETFPG